jgi:hypothetical protein
MGIYCGADGMSDQRRAAVWLMYWLRGEPGNVRTVAEGGLIGALPVFSALSSVLPKLFTDEAARQAQQLADGLGGAQQRAAQWYAGRILGGRTQQRDYGGDVEPVALVEVLGEITPSIRDDPGAVAANLGGIVQVLAENEEGLLDPPADKADR